VNDNLQPGFRIGDWEVYPQQNLLKRPDQTRALEPKVMDVLVFLADRQGEVVSRQQILDAVWYVVVVGDETLSRAVSVLRTDLGDDQKNPRYLKTISKRGYRFIAEVLPLASEGSEEVDSVSEPLDSATPQYASGFIAHYFKSRTVVAIISVLLLTLGYHAYDILVLAPARELAMLENSAGLGRTQALMESESEHSIAVLPFVNMSDDASNDYFSDGVSAELLNLLAQIPELRVISRSSSFSFRGKDIDIPTVAERLNVAHILEGSVRKVDNRVRITAKLIDARADTHLWSESYDRELENVFEIQEEISTAIVGALRPHLNLLVVASPRARRTTNTDAHEAYLRGRYLVAQSTQASIEEAIYEFERALSYDRNYALAHAELALAIIYRVRNLRSTADAAARAIPHVERAMALDPTLAEAHAANGYLLWSQEQWEDALTHFRRAVQINPNYVIAYVWMGNLLSWKLGRYDEAFQMREAAMRLDPLSIPTIVYYLQALIERNRLAEADRELEKIASIFPHVYAYRRGSRASIGGNIANAVLGSLDALMIDPSYSQVREGLAYHLAALGLEKEALAVSEEPRPGVLSYLGKSGDVLAIAKARVARDPNSLRARHDLGLALAGAGDYARARPILEEMWRLSSGRISKRSDLFTTASAAALIAIRRDAGEETGVSELVAAIKDNVRRYRKAGIVGDGRSYGVDYEEGLALYLSGDRVPGLALLNKGTADGVFISPNEAYLQSIYDDPGFAPILTRQKARQVRERQKVLAIVCTDNPYQAVWQPAEGTCERFAASGGS
jgi:TolB-like protein/DNA-binding winged helix-turn-helix (wHTH) protein